MERSKLTYYLRDGDLPAHIAAAAVDAASAVLKAFLIDPKMAQWCADYKNEAKLAEMFPFIARGDSSIRMLEAQEFGAQAWEIACQAADEVVDVFGFGPGELTNYPEDAEKARAAQAAKP